jgi:hypothetical protein
MFVDGVQMRDWYTTHGDVPMFRTLAVEVNPILLHMSDVYDSIWCYRVVT